MAKLTIDEPINIVVRFGNSGGGIGDGFWDKLDKRIYLLVDYIKNNYSEISAVSDGISKLYNHTDELTNGVIERVEAYASKIIEFDDEFAKTTQTAVFDAADRILSYLNPKVTLVSTTQITAIQSYSVSEVVAKMYIPAYIDASDEHLYVLVATGYPSGTSISQPLAAMAFKNALSIVQSSSSKQEPIVLLGIAIAKRFDDEKAGKSEWVSIGTDYTRVVAGTTLELREYSVDMRFDADGVKDALQEVLK